jgi:L-threonylcarbamoyladenylate synthase
MASLVSPDAAGLARAGEQLRAGLLVSFPTETVYGLGANALNPDAVLSIFRAKGRPLTDPLIVHVPALEDAAALVDLTPAGRAVFECLGRAFWPGPLTLIAKAVPALPLTVSAQTGFVGLRVPAHPIAQKLLREARVPVAAPSANRFGHVSPTSAAHVMDDLGACANLSVIDDAGEDSCQVGIESTVAKVVPETRQIVVFRRGGVSERALQRVLDEHAEALGGRFEVVAVKPPQHKSEADTHEAEDGVAQQAPGQLLTHYAPDVDTYLIQADAAEDMPLSSEPTDKWVVIDFGGAMVTLQDRVLAYQDLSVAGDVPEASQHIFDALRWAEAVPGVSRVLVADVKRVDHEHAAALHDRMFRAASGKCRALRL